MTSDVTATIKTREARAQGEPRFSNNVLYQLTPELLTCSRPPLFLAPSRVDMFERIEVEADLRETPSGLRRHSAVLLIHAPPHGM